MLKIAILFCRDHIIVVKAEALNSAAGSMWYCSVSRDSVQRSYRRYFGLPVALPNAKFQSRVFIFYVACHWNGLLQ